jgi:Fic family protein
VTDLFEGKRVIGPARDIQEVRNAIAAYEALPRWNPSNQQHLLQANGLLMAGLMDRPGRFRTGGVGIYRREELVHMAPPASRVPGLIADLLSWLEQTDWHPLLASCVVHYELEFIHPFADGNGRLGRLWQTLTLSRWNPLLGWLPIEEVIRARQQGYYESLGQADQRGELEPFVSYLLAAIADALEDALRPPATSPAGSEISSEMGSEIIAPREVQVLELLSAHPRLSAREMGGQLGISQRAIEKHLAALQRQGRLRRLGSPRSGSWQVLPPGSGD